MSNYSKRAKSMKRPHRERGQPSDRARLGLLEKHKDYILRARDYHRKRHHLKLLQEKARNRNPDEFYYKMVHTQLKDGSHVIPHPKDSYSPAETALMKTQDIKYVEMKLASERKKVERLQSTLHLVGGARPAGTHTIFLDSQEEAPALLPLTPAHKQPDNSSCKSTAPYRELAQRMSRAQQLQQVAGKMRTQRHVLRSAPTVRIPGSQNGTPVTYKWRTERLK